LATSLPTSQPWALAGRTYDDDGGNDLRNSTVVPFFYNTGGSSSAPLGGVIGGFGLVVSAAGGMTVGVTYGSYVVPNTSDPAAGAYVATLVSSGNLTLASADPSNPRIDIVVAGVTDNGDSSSSGWVQVITGTAAASPSVPAAPANSIIVGTIQVPAGATTITSGNITGNANFTTTAGGVLVCQKSAPPAGYYGQVAYDWPAQGFFHNSAGGPLQMRTLPFAPVVEALTGGSYTLPTAAGQVPGLTANVTCDGQTDLKITVHVAGFTGIASEAAYVTVGCYIDGTLVDEQVVALTASTSAQGGLTLIGYTGSGFGGNTPSAGSHTVSVQAWSSVVSGASPQIHAFSGLPNSAWMRVEPVNL
jgi:hypothetical protein